ncbi:hypothetical protein E1I18_00885 [Mycoplasmopsis mucosicanis]|uniref:Lipoprotein-associated type-17 domain-containing protein n=1 Tax=Mycoplasmopsis mucosicanis TaxID=458208 RepID=A0A507SQB6_9BACT|nr:lipoprotein 17-related variable surface protein [Mycoplasmopsis mucosicanis]TQC54000.1 hypothetical protein E1I18_00885 [Mycoplasmopsis mucosicanis]
MRGGANNNSGQGGQSTPAPQPQPEPQNPGDSSNPDTTPQPGPGDGTPAPQPQPENPGDSNPDTTPQPGPGDNNPAPQPQPENPKDPNDGTGNDSGSENKIDPDVKEAYDIFSKHTKLFKSKKSWDFFSRANDGVPIYYDYRKKAFYAEKYDSKDPDKERTLLFSLEEGHFPKYSYNASWPDDKDEHGKNDIFNKVKLVKLEDKFGFKFRVSKYEGGKKNTFPNPTIVQQSELQEFKVPSADDVKGVLDSIEIKYENKENVEEKDATKSGVKVPPEANGYTTHVESVTPKIGERKIDVVIYLTYKIGDDTVESQRRTIEIDGFKSNDLASKVKDVVIVYEGNKKDKLPSEVTEKELKAKLNNNDLESTISVSYSLKADDYKGELSVNATFSTNNNSVEIPYILNGFKMKEFNLKDFINKYPKPTLDSKIENNKSNTPAISVGADKFTLKPAEDGVPVTIKITSVAPQENDKTKLDVTVTFTNTLNNTKEERTYTFEGFMPQKEYRDNKAFKEAEKGNLFHYTASEANNKAILEFIKKTETEKKPKHPLLAIDGQDIYFYPKSAKKKVQGLKLDPSAKHILTHTGKNTVAPAFLEGGKKPSNQEKGLELVKTSTSVEIQFKLVLAGEGFKYDSKIYKFKLFDLKSDTGNSSQSNPGSSSRSEDDE